MVFNTLFLCVGFESQIVSASKAFSRFKVGHLAHVRFSLELLCLFKNFHVFHTHFHQIYVLNLQQNIRSGIPQVGCIRFLPSNQQEKLEECILGYSQESNSVKVEFAFILLFLISNKMCLDKFVFLYYHNQFFNPLSSQ